MVLNNFSGEGSVAKVPGVNPPPASVSMINKTWYSKLFDKTIRLFILKTARLALKILKWSVPTEARLKIKGHLPVFVVCQIWKKYENPHWPLPEKAKLPGLSKYEYSLFSQNGEDGILRYIFSQIGYSTRFFVEIGFEVTECNSLRLMVKERVDGLFIDGVERSVKKFNKAAKKSHFSNVKAINKFLDVDNLKDTLLYEGHIPTEIDLLSIDVDGNDYWFWEKINFITPRLVIVEYNASLGPDVSLAVPYDPLFERHKKHDSGFYCSASLTAFNKLAIQKGYSLIGCDSAGVNAFFMRNDCLTDKFPVLTPAEAYRPHASRINRGISQEEQFNMIKDMPYVTI